MYPFLRDRYLQLHESFHGSEVIIWARLQVVLGSLYAGLLLLDLTPFDLDPKYVTAWTVGNGILSEYLRRRRAEYDDTTGSLK